ncbi:MAG: hypothetical protein ACT4PY_11065 [Armatimonadota bacterium]
MRSMMRWCVVVFLALIAAATPSTALASPEPGADLALTNVSHALDGRSLTVSGWVENRGRAPIGRLVIDASGVSPAGEVTAFGSDGIPWLIRSGESIQFTIRLSVDSHLIRAYSVQVAFARTPIRPLTSVRRTVELELYRPLLLSGVRAQAEIRGRTLTVRADAQRLPVALVIVEVRLLDVHMVGLPLEERRLDVLIVDVPADGSATVHLGTPAFLLRTRVVDVRLKVAW